jgi:hypothetical protein
VRLQDGAQVLQGAVAQEAEAVLVPEHKRRQVGAWAGLDECCHVRLHQHRGGGQPDEREAAQLP